MEDFVGITYIQQNSALLFEYILFGGKVITLVERNVFDKQFVACFILFNLLITYDKFTLNSYAPLLWCLILIHLSFAYCELPIAVVEIERMSYPTGQSWDRMNVMPNRSVLSHTPFHKHHMCLPINPVVDLGLPLLGQGLHAV